MIYWRETYPHVHHHDAAEGEWLEILDEDCFADFSALFSASTGLPKEFLSQVTSIHVAG